MKKLKNYLVLLTCISITPCSNLMGQYNKHYLTPQYNFSIKSVKSTVVDKDGYTTSVYSMRENGYSTTDVHIIKLNSNGNVIYQKSYGTKNNRETGNGLCLTEDRGNIIVGEYNHPNLGQGIFAFKVNFIGNLIWSRWYGTPNYPNGRGVTIERTQEQSENYIICGTADNYRKIAAIKINGNGNQLWSNVYFNPSYNLKKRHYVTDITQDYKTRGIVITGFESDNYSDTTQTIHDIFTFGIDLNGVPSRPFLKYINKRSTKNESPNINNAANKKEFYLTFSSYSSSIAPSKNRIPGVMKLSSDLIPNWTNYYINPDSNENYFIGHSIYDFKDEYLAVGSFMYHNSGDLKGFHPSFLKLDPFGNFQNFVIHDFKDTHFSTYMAQHPNQKEYVLHNFKRSTNDIDVHHIKTDDNGLAEQSCEKRLELKYEKIDLKAKRQYYLRTWFGTSTTIPLKYQTISPKQFHCYQNNAPAPQSTGNNNFNSDLNHKDKIKIFPSIVNSSLTEEILISMELTNQEQIDIQVFDNVGRLKYQNSIEGTEGIGQIKIKTSQLPMGISYIRFSTRSNSIIKTTKVVRIN